MKPKKSNQRIQDKNNFEKLLKKYGYKPSNNYIADIWRKVYILFPFILYSKEIAYTYLKKEEPDPFIARLASNVTAIYLLEWIENDPQCRQSLKSFILSPYSSCDENIKRLQGDMDNEQLAKLKRAEKKYSDLIALQNEEAKRNKLPFKRLVYQKNAQDRLYNFIDLRYIDQYSQNKFPRAFHDYLFHKQPPPISKACEQYTELLAEIESLKSCKEAVISYFQLIKYELTHRFVLYGKIAKHRKNQSISKYESLPPYIQIMIFAGAHKKSRHFISHKKIGNSIWLWKYDQFMDALFSSNLSEDRCYRLLEIREAMHTTLKIYNAFYPVKKVHSWTEKDFEDAFDFLINGLEVLDIFTPFDYDSKYKKDYYDCFDTMFKLNSHIVTSKRQRAKRILQEKIHKRVSKKK